MVFIILIELIIFTLSGLMLGYGDNTRGTYSKLISNVAGFLWLIGIIIAFWLEGLTFGIVAILSSFVIAAVAMNIGKYLALSLRRKL